MSEAVITPLRVPRSLAALDGVALVLTLLLPFLLLHSRAFAEIAIDAIAVLFLVTAATTRRWRWLQQDWMVLGLLWWGWELFCTVIAVSGGAGRPVLQAVLMLRFIIFVAALQHWVLAGARARRWFLGSLALASAYVAGQTVLQFLSGRNLFGDPRYADGSLTGPFAKPRAGPTFIRMLFPPLLFAAGALLSRRTLPARAGAGALVLATVAVVVLIGQRMPVLLLLLGLFIAALYLPQLRRIAIVAVLASAALIGASAVIAPPTFYRLVTKFSDQMAHFPDSHYGEITGRALVIAGQHPWAGLGFNGFETGCPDPQFFHGWHWPENPADDGGGAVMCVGHPHNHYLQALDDAGLPGLLLFCGLVLAWLRRLGRGLWRNPEPLRVGLFVAAIIQEWPIASTSPIISLPIGGWFFLLLGFGLAVADQARLPPRLGAVVA